MKLNLHVTRFLLLLAVVLMTAVVDLRAQDVPVTDSMYLADSHPVIFIVNRTEIRQPDSVWIREDLVPTLKALGPNSYVYGRSAASPEGPYWNNIRLANGRRMALNNVLVQNGVDTCQIVFKTVIEDYWLLLEMLRQAGDGAYPRVRQILEQCGDNDYEIKRRMKAVRGGEMWARLLRDYYPKLRATRLYLVYQMSDVRLRPQFELLPPTARLVPDLPLPPVIGRREINPRRELLSVKTNLLGWGLAIPQYGGWCPIPNVALEYYPKHGHFTYGLSFDCPWWIGNTTNHKYMEVRNYLLESRYYFRNSDLSYPDNRKAAFKGWYAEAYIQNGLYQIGFSKTKGWIGEHLGGGLGFGYVLPISRLQHWRLEFGAQVGYFTTWYDPFVYGKPVYHGGEEDGLYYYDTPLYRKDFVKRQHRFTWMGPTRVGITLSYDLLYRRHVGKRPSFSKWEKGAGL